MKNIRYVVLILGLPLWGMQSPDPVVARAKLKEAKILFSVGQANRARDVLHLAERAAFVENSPRFQMYAHLWSAFCRLRIGALNLVAYKDVMRYFRAAHDVAPDQQLKTEIETLMSLVLNLYLRPTETISCKTTIMTTSEASARALQKRTTFYEAQWREQQERQKALIRSDKKI